METSNEQTADEEEQSESVPQMQTLQEIEAMRPPEREIQPYVSVIIAARNEEGFITRCLQALEAQDYPRERFEVILVDGDSTDATSKEVREMALAYGLPDVFKTNPAKTTAAGLNIGLMNAGGEVIVKVDGRTRVDPDFISANVEALKETGADAVGGRIRTRGHGPEGRAIALAMASPFGVGGASFRIPDESESNGRRVWADSVPFAAYRRHVFSQVGGFAEDIEFGEDDEFNYRLRESGGRILLSDKVKSLYFCRPKLSELLRQYWNYGLAKLEVLGRHPRRARPYHLVPGALVLGTSFGLVLSLLQRRLSWLFLLSTGTYAIANGLASLRIGLDGNKQEMRYLPLAFAAMHFGSGGGMLAGIWRAVKRRLQPGTSLESE